MTGKSTTLIGLSFFIILFSLPVSASAQFAVSKPEKGVKWLDFETGISKAVKENKKYIIYVKAQWCDYCAKLEEMTFTDDEVIQYVDKNFVPIMVDGEAESYRFGDVETLEIPMILFFNPDQTLLTKTSGFVDPAAFLIMLKYFNTDSYKKMSPKAYINTMKK